MQTILTVVHLVLALSLVGLVLLQHGKGADAGAAFGSGASSTVFGARGSGSFLTRSTAALATLFFVTSIALAYYSAQVGEPEGLMDQIDTRGPAVLPQQDAAGDLPVAPGDLDGPPVPPSEATAPRAGAETDLPPLPTVDEPAADANPARAGMGEDLPVVDSPPVNDDN
jgi:preprotein translocase subunit SecG